MLPNLLIIGSIKGGTTSLQHYLAQHPEISMSARKELHYFDRDDWRERRDWYEAQFEGFDTPIRGEATPHYTVHPGVAGVPEKIASLIPDAKLVYSVRDPLERLRSHAVQRLAQGDRTPLSHYLRTWETEPNGVVHASFYATQLERYLDCFGAEQILVVDQHDLRTDRRATLREVFEFLGVDPDFHSPAFDRELNSRSEKHALTRVGDPVWNHVLGPAVRRLPERVQHPVRKHTIRALSRKITYEPVIDADVRPRLEERLRDEADRLRALTGKRFASWSV